MTMPSRRLRLFCFPHAGRGGSLFHGWNEGLPDSIVVCPVTLPGHEHRLGEPAIDDVQALARTMARELHSSFQEPFAFFGHSLGALLAFELARHLCRSGSLAPTCLALSGHRAPHIPRNGATTYDRPTDEFLMELRRLEGTPAEVLCNAPLLALVLPALRADFKAAESYRYDAGPPLNCPIIAYGGAHDSDIPNSDLVAWAAHTRDRFCVRMFEGGHFYINAQRRELMAQLGVDLRRFCGLETGDAG
jgi:medium-chain acyl-[acyl-carrier-protein] hydrolase